MWKGDDEYREIEQERGIESEFSLLGSGQFIVSSLRSLFLLQCYTHFHNFYFTVDYLVCVFKIKSQLTYNSLSLFAFIFD